MSRNTANLFFEWSVIEITQLLLVGSELIECNLAVRVTMAIARLAISPCKTRQLHITSAPTTGELCSSDSCPILPPPHPAREPSHALPSISTATL